MYSANRAEMECDTEGRKAIEKQQRKKKRKKPERETLTEDDRRLFKAPV